MPSGTASIPFQVRRHVPLHRKIVNLAAAAVDVAAAALAAPTAPLTVPDDVLALRRAACAGCEYHDPAGNLGLGECKHQACGCTGAKLHLAALHCPLDPPKWDCYLPPQPL